MNYTDQLIAYLNLMSVITSITKHAITGDKGTPQAYMKYAGSVFVHGLSSVLRTGESSSVWFLKYLLFKLLYDV